MEQVVSNLKYIQKVLQNEEYQSYKPIMHVTLVETISEVKEHDFVYTVNYTKESWKSHMPTYKNYGRRYKAQLLSSLEELLRELSIKNTNVKRCKVLITELLNTNLYQNRVQNKLSKWVYLNMNKPTVRIAKIHVMKQGV